MKEQDNLQNDEISIDLGRIFGTVVKRGWLVALVSVLCAVIALAGTYFFITPQYESAATFYVNNNSGGTQSISSGDLTTSRNLVDSYIVILNTRETLNEVIAHAGVDLTCGQLQDMISAESVNNTEIFQVCVTSPDPDVAVLLADAIAYVLPQRISTIIDGASAKVVGAAVAPTSPSSPSYPVNALIGFMLGFLLTVGVIVLREVFDITIRTEEDVTRCCSQPILASVPDFSEPGQGNFGYGEKRGIRKKGADHPAARRPGRQTAVVTQDVSFSAAEAFKLLRTKLQFSFADDNDCHVIGLSSALSGEGKSLTAVNLAYALAQLEKKVILVDCDMRRPTLAEKLGVAKKPGLSSYLTGQSSLESLVQACNPKGVKETFHVITAGQNPPNPIELLSSTRMRIALNALRKVYDYVILDLPPVGEVSDAMAVAKELDGMLLVVRQNYCNRNALAEAVRQFEFVNCRILGTVINGAEEVMGTYGKTYYMNANYRSYGKKRSAGSDTVDRSPAAAGKGKAAQ